MKTFFPAILFFLTLSILGAVSVDDIFVREVVALLDDIGAREYASAKAESYSSAARRHLRDATPQGEAGEALFQLANMLLQRDY